MRYDDKLTDEIIDQFPYIFSFHQQFTNPHWNSTANTAEIDSMVGSFVAAKHTVNFSSIFPDVLFFCVFHFICDIFMFSGMRHKTIFIIGYNGIHMDRYKQPLDE